MVSIQRLAASALLGAISCVTAVPSAFAQTGERMVTGSRSYSPMVADLDASVAFFRDVLGLEVPPPPDGAVLYPWAHETWHRHLHGLPGSPMRFATLAMPSALVPGAKMLVEPVQQGAIELHPISPRVSDGGAFTFIVVVRDLAPVLERVRAAGTPIVTQGGAPVPVPRYGGNSRAIVVKDPDGQFVEIAEIDPTPESTAAADQNLLGARLRITVTDMEQTLGLYRDRLGLTFDEDPFTKDPSLDRLFGIRGAEYRIATTRIPGSNQHLEFLEVRGVKRTPIRSRIEDPGSVRFQLMVSNLERAQQLFCEAGPCSVVSNTGQVLQDGSWEKGPIPQGPIAWLTLSELNNVYLILGARPAN